MLCSAAFHLLWRGINEYPLNLIVNDDGFFSSYNVGYFSIEMLFDFITS